MTRRCRWCWDSSIRSTACDVRCAGCATPSNSSPPRCATRSAAPSRPRGAAVKRDRRRPAGMPAGGRRSVLLELKRLETGAGAALDAGGDQPLDIEAVADQFEHPQFLLAGLAIGRRDIAGDRIGGLAQFDRQRLLDRGQGVLEPVLAPEQPAAFLQYPRQLLMVEIAEYRQIADDVADNR